MNTYRRRKPALLLTAGLAALILGGTAYPAAVAASPRNVRVRVGRTDYRFLFRSAQRSLFEYRAARLAQSKASRAAVRQYAGDVVRAHSARQAELSRVLRDKGLTPPNSPSATDKRRLARLSALRGTAFDRAYIREAVRINQEDRTTAQREARLTRDRDIQDYLRRFAPTDQAQLRGALALRR